MLTSMLLGEKSGNLIGLSGRTQREREGGGGGSGSKRLGDGRKEMQEMRVHCDGHMHTVCPQHEGQL